VVVVMAMTVPPPVMVVMMVMVMVVLRKLHGALVGRGAEVAVPVLRPQT